MLWHGLRSRPIMNQLPSRASSGKGAHNYGLLLRGTVPYIQRVPAGAGPYARRLRARGGQLEDALGEVPQGRGGVPARAFRADGFRHYGRRVRRQDGRGARHRGRSVVHLRQPIHRRRGRYGGPREGLQGRLRHLRRKPFPRHDARASSGSEGAVRPLHHARHRRRKRSRQAARHRDRARLPPLPHVHGREGGRLHDAAREAGGGSGWHLSEGRQRYHLGPQAELAAHRGCRRPSGGARVPQGLRLPQVQSRRAFGRPQALHGGCGHQFPRLRRARAGACRGRRRRAVHR